MFNLKDYADRLAALYVRRKELQIGVSHNETDIEARKIAMVPAAGWLADAAKATDATRKSAGEKAYAEDEPLQKMRAMLTKLRDELSMLEGEIEAQEVLLRAAEYQIKQDLNDILRRKYITVEPDGEPDADADDAHDAVQEAITEVALYDDEPDSELPF